MMIVLIKFFPSILVYFPLVGQSNTIPRYWYQYKTNQNNNWCRELLSHNDQFEWIINGQPPASSSIFLSLHFAFFLDET